MCRVHTGVYHRIFSPGGRLKSRLQWCWRRRVRSTPMVRCKLTQRHIVSVIVVVVVRWSHWQVMRGSTQEHKTEKSSLCVAFAALCIYICQEPKWVTAMERRLSVANEAVFGLIIMRNFEGNSLKYCTSSKYGSKPLRLNHPRSRPSILDLGRGNRLKREFDWF